MAQKIRQNLAVAVVLPALLWNSVGAACSVYCVNDDGHSRIESAHVDCGSGRICSTGALFEARNPGCPEDCGDCVDIPLTSLTAAKIASRSVSRAARPAPALAAHIAANMTHGKSAGGIFSRARPPADMPDPGLLGLSTVVLLC